MPIGGLFRQYGAFLGVLHRAIDVGTLLAGLYIASQLFDIGWAHRHPLAVAWAAVLFLVIAEVRQLYASWRTSSLIDELRHVFLICIAVWLGLVAIAFLTKTSADYSRLVIATWFASMPLLLGIERALIRAFLWILRSRGFNSRTVAIVGLTPTGLRIKESIESERWTGLRVLGFYDSRGAQRASVVSGGSRVELHGTWENLIRDVHSGLIDYVYIALPLTAKARIVEIVNALADTTASVYVVPDLFVSDLAHGRWSAMGGMPVVSVFDSPFFGVDGWMKRVEDLVLGTVFLVIAVVPMLIIAIAIAFTTRDSIFFLQRRYGLNGRVMRILKFRTMTLSEDGPTISQLQHNDPRITRIGKILRATSLDELPQLFNVLGGSMSLVGPRPHAVAVNEEYRRLIHGYMLRHKVKPGITGWAQVNGWHGDDSLDSMQRRVDHDLEYVRNWSLLLDLKILALTILGLFTRKNVY